MKVFASLLLVTFVASTLGVADVSTKDDSLDNNLRLALEKLREAMPIGVSDLGIPPLDPFQVQHFDIPHIEEGVITLDDAVKHLDDSLDNNLRLALEKLREAMPTGLPYLGIPHLDPFQVPHFDIPHIEEGVIKLDAAVNDLVITNLASFDPRVVHANPDLLTLESVLFIPKLMGFAHYTLNGTILGLLPIFGKGPMFLEVDGLEISALAGLSISPDGQYIQVQDLNLDVDIESMNIHLDNLLGGGELGDAVNSIMSRLGKVLLDLDTQLPIFEDFTETLTSFLNEILSKCTLNEIISDQCELKAFVNLLGLFLKN